MTQQVDINHILGSVHESYLRIIKELTHELAVVRAQMAALQKEEPDAE